MTYKLGERYIKLNALKKITAAMKDCKLVLIDHVMEGVRVIIKKSDKIFDLVLPDKDRPTVDDAEAYIKEKLK